MEHAQESKQMVAAVTNVLSDTYVAKQNDDYNNLAQIMVESAALENKTAAASKAVKHPTGRKHKTLCSVSGNSLEDRTPTNHFSNLLEAGESSVNKVVKLVLATFPLTLIQSSYN